MAEAARAGTRGEYPRDFEGNFGVLANANVGPFEYRAEPTWYAYRKGTLRALREAPAAGTPSK